MAFARELGLSSIIIEEDFEVIIKALRSEEVSFVSFGHLIANGFSFLSFSHFRRQAVTHNFLVYPTFIDKVIF